MNFSSNLSRTPQSQVLSKKKFSTGQKVAMWCGGCLSVLIVLWVVGMVASTIIPSTIPSTGEKPNASRSQTQPPDVSSSPAASSSSSSSSKNIEAASNSTTQAYKTGYERGHELGVGNAKGGGGMPTEVGMNITAKNHSGYLGLPGSSDCEKGFIEGFQAGYKSIKPFNRKASNYENLSWANAAVGLRLYDYNEKHVATIVSVNPNEDIIYVKFTKEGIIEPKKLSALSNFWYIKK